MTEAEWLELKEYLDKRWIEYRTVTACISGEASSFIVELPPVVRYHNNPKDLENAYPGLCEEWTNLWNRLKGVL